MRLLSAIHRWAGAFIGLLLTVLGLSGAILVWEGDWINLPGADDVVIEDVGRIAAIAEKAAADGQLSRITFASDELGLHQIIYRDGGGIYVRQDGVVIDSWANQWGRPELWIFDLHHYLFAGQPGEIITGIAGLAGIAFVITGLILWWRCRRRFVLRLWPHRLEPGPIVKQHKDLGAATAPLLMLSLVTGVLMLFAPLRGAILGEELRPKVELPQTASETASPIKAALRASKDLFPDARLRRLTMPTNPGDVVSIRMKQTTEWTPNGRTQLRFDAPTGRVLSVEDATAGNRASWFSEKLYPIHSAKTGGTAMKILMTVSGLVLAILGSLAFWSFWIRRHSKRRVRTPGAPLPPRRRTRMGADHKRSPTSVIQTD